jgi:hypothetical protein
MCGATVNFEGELRSLELAMLCNSFCFTLRTSVCMYVCVSHINNHHVDALLLHSGVAGKTVQSGVASEIETWFESPMLFLVEDPKARD